MDKGAIRTIMLQRRSAMLPDQVAQLSHLAQRRLATTDMFAAAQSVALYSPVHNETATSDIFALACCQGKQIFYPRVAGASLHFVRVNRLAQLVAGSFGVLEPAANLKAGRQVPELILIPGIAFDRRGHRLGYGRGFYDRYLACCPERVVRVGFSYSFQLCDVLPVSTHDQALDALVTDAETITWRSELPGLT